MNNISKIYFKLQVTQFTQIYAQFTARAPLKRPSLTNTNSILTNKKVDERLRSSSSSNRFRKQGISPFCKPSQTSEIKNKAFEK